ncbi:MAG: calcium/sodium antiporter [Thermoplasmata archaeon]|nr:calcium/sodium antiporter [Thermoplasmata archaeon]
MFASLLIFMTSFFALIYSTEFFVKGIEGLRAKYGISLAVSGASIAAIGSSMPEFASSLFSVFEKHPKIGIATIVGSAIFNITIIVGVSVIIKKTKVSKEVVNRDGLFYLIAILLLSIFSIDGKITRYEMIIFVVAYIFYAFFLIKHKREKAKNIDLKKNLNFFIKSLLLRFFSANFLIKETVEITSMLGLSEAVFSLIVIAIGTSLPDLFTSIHAARLGYGDMAISNAIGSNTFDILIGIGLPYSLTKSVEVAGALNFSLLFLFISYIITFLILYFRQNMGKFEGMLFISIYAIFLIFILMG